MTTKKLYFLIALLLSLHLLSFKVFACQGDQWHGTNLMCRYMMTLYPNKHSQETVYIEKIPTGHNYHCSFTFHCNKTLTDADAYFQAFQARDVTYKVTKRSGAYKYFTMRNVSGKPGLLRVTIGRDKDKYSKCDSLSIFIVCNARD